MKPILDAPSNKSVRLIINGVYTHDDISFIVKLDLDLRQNVPSIDNEYICSSIHGPHRYEIARDDRRVISPRMVHNMYSIVTKSQHKRKNRYISHYDAEGSDRLEKLM